MQKFIPLLLIVNLILTGCKEQVVTPVELANQFIKEYKQYSSVSYDIDYQIKYFNQIEDTTKVTAQVDLIRETNDSIFGGYIWITADSVSTYYNTEALYSINHVVKKIIKYPKEKTSPLTGSILSDLYNTYFLKPTRLKRGIQDPVTIATLTEETLAKRNVWKVNYKINDVQNVANIRKNIWIDKEKLIPTKINYSADSQGESQYNQWNLKNVSFNTTSIEVLEKRLSSAKEKYELEEYQEKEENQVGSLPNGKPLPNLPGILYSSLNNVKLHDYLDKLTLYDVWYMDCPPCIKAIPHLNELYNKYAEMGLKVVGINPFNNNKKDLKRFPNFLNHNKIDYHIVFVDREASNDLKVQAYPTFYLVDNKGNILHSEIGFNQEKAKVLDKQLNAYLKNN